MVAMLKYSTYKCVFICENLVNNRLFLTNLLSNTGLSIINPYYIYKKYILIKLVSTFSCSSSF